MPPSPVRWFPSLVRLRFKHFTRGAEGMPIHPQVRVVLERRAGWPPKTPPASIEERRELFSNTWREVGPEVFKVEDRLIPGPAGEIPVRIYTPSDGGPFPALVEFHGGGFIHGDIDSYDGNCRRLCEGAGCVVVNVHYRRAPGEQVSSGGRRCLRRHQVGGGKRALHQRRPYQDRCGGR